MGNDTYFKRIMQFATEQVCRTCHGHRLQEKFLAVRIQGKNIGELAALSVEDSLKFFATLALSKSLSVSSFSMACDSTMSHFLAVRIRSRGENLRESGLPHKLGHDSRGSSMFWMSHLSGCIRVTMICSYKT